MRWQDPALSVLCRWDGRTATVTVSGEVDFATAGILSAQLDEVVSQEPDHLIVDLGQTCFIDAAGLRAIARARQALPEQCQVTLRSPTRQVRKIIEISGLITLCPIEETGPPGQSAG